MALDVTPGWSQDVGDSPSKREMHFVLQIKQTFSSVPPTPVCATQQTSDGPEPLAWQGLRGVWHTSKFLAASYIALGPI